MDQEGAISPDIKSVEGDLAENSRKTQERVSLVLRSESVDEDGAGISREFYAYLPRDIDGADTELLPDIGVMSDTRPVPVGSAALRSVDNQHFLALSVFFEEKRGKGMGRAIFEAIDEFVQDLANKTGREQVRVVQFNEQVDQVSKQKVIHIAESLGYRREGTEEKWIKRITPSNL